jgi:hypothetical protein
MLLKLIHLLMEFKDIWIVGYKTNKINQEDFGKKNK